MHACKIVNMNLFILLFVGRRHGPYGTLNYHIPSSTSLRGVVYFSDVSQLRSALVEMQGHRLSIGSSRNTGFGQSQQTNNLVWVDQMCMQ